MKIITHINITIDKNIPLDNSNIDNINIMSNHSDIIFQKSVDVPPYALINYANSDGGDSFQYKLKPKKDIINFNLKVKNQDGEVIPHMTDYLLVLQFVKHKTYNKTESILESILDYIKQMFMMLGLQIFPKLEENNLINE